jgi:hypothetical protein
MMAQRQSYSSALSLISVLDRCGWPRPHYPGEKPNTHCTGGWVGPTASLDGCGKSRLQPGFDPRTVQSVGSRYKD